MLLLDDIDQFSFTYAVMNIWLQYNQLIYSYSLYIYIYKAQQH